MNILYEESGDFKVGAVLADNITFLQVEAPHGKRSKIKAGAVVLKFEQPPLAEFMRQAQALAAELEVDFLWQCCGEEEFLFSELAQEYFGRTATAVEVAGVLLRLHASPMHFYKKGKGKFKAAPEAALKAALAGAERKRQQLLKKAGYVAQLSRYTLPAEFEPQLDALLYQPDKNSIEYKALEEACAATQLAVHRLLAKCGGISSPHDYHFNRFLFECFPKGTAFNEPAAILEHRELAVAEVAAFSIDDAGTTEIDDAFSVARLDNGNWRIGIHIAAPALGVAPHSALDTTAAQRLSTVYVPGGKITMLPQQAIERFTLQEGRACPALSLYLEVAAEGFAVVASESRIERVPIAANLRRDELEQHFDEEALAGNPPGHPFQAELEVLWKFANSLEQTRGRPDLNRRKEYSFVVEGEGSPEARRVTITERRRGSPIDKIVSELMIYANAQWGGQLASAGIAAIYRVQANGKARMSTEPMPHEGLGAEQYLWATSPLRRYVDLINQRQLLALLNGEPAPYTTKSDALLAAMLNFELAYQAYADIQRTMERYWCLRYLAQENWTSVSATLIRENLVQFDDLPLTARIPALPQAPEGTTVLVELSQIDLWELSFHCSPVPEKKAAGAV